MKTKTQPTPLQVELARRETGYRSHPMRESAFGRAVSYPGQPWAGSFVHEVLRETGLLETAFVSTTAALAWYLRHERVFYDKPRPGDVVFYAYGSTGPFDQPHVGIVTETALYVTTGEFRAVEGETASGLARGSQDKDGVFERVRYKPEVLGFVRPREPRPVELRNLSTDVLEVRPTNFAKGSPVRARATTAVQLALYEATGAEGFAQGMWDGLTRTAFEEFLRHAGVHSPIESVPSELQLRVLSDLTYGRYFTVAA